MSPTARGLAQDRFFQHFLAYMQAQGLSAEQMHAHVWKPHHPHDLKLLGPDRDRDFKAIELSERDIRAQLSSLSPGGFCINGDFYRDDRTVYVLVPGFTHETLRNLSLHEVFDDRRSSHDVLMLRPGIDGQPTQEEWRAKGGGLKLVYAQYPRSNADSLVIGQPLFELLHNSATLRRWVVDEGCRIVFLGYSYGCPLTLELLANLNRGTFADNFILKATKAVVAMCGAIGGSYLADDVLKPHPQLLSIPKLVARCQKHHWLSALAGMPTQQFRDDMVGGVTSLTREVRHERAMDYAPHLPAHVHYFTLSAVMPMMDYRRHWWQFNLDDYSMWLQAKVSEPVCIYNDGQVVTLDNLMPKESAVPENHIHHLGAVRGHHWAVSYRTFNFGRNRFPRKALYKAMLHTLVELTDA